MSRNLNKFDRFSLWALGLSFPIIFGLIIFFINYITNDPIVKTLKPNETYNYTGGVWDYVGIFFISWVLLAIIMLFRLLMSATLRQTVLSFVARIKERDEREEEISGHAAKFSFFANLALLVFLLFFSTVTFNVKKYPEAFLDGAGDKKHGTLSMGLNFHTHDDKDFEITKSPDKTEINYTQFPLSKSMIFALLIAWQVGTYHLSARKRMKIG